MKSAALGAAGIAGTALADPVSKGQPEWMLVPGATTDDYGQTVSVRAGAYQALDGAARRPGRHRKIRRGVYAASFDAWHLDARWFAL